MISAALALKLALAAGQHSESRPDPSVRDLYVGCYLLISNAETRDTRLGTSAPFTEVECAAQIAFLLSEREGRRDGESNRWRFCLPRSVAVSANRPHAMASAYLEYVEDHPNQLRQTNGPAVFVIAMARSWPCPA
jgi:hypothetical protein